jgi:hypothetical protein
MIDLRLKFILKEVISLAQSAFVPGMLITDNILVAYKTMHTIENKKGKFGYCAVKLDMHKAYDRVEWLFLENALIQLGFNSEWSNYLWLVSSLRSTKSDIMIKRLIVLFI